LRHALALLAPHLQTILAIEPIHALVVHREALPAHEIVEATIASAGALPPAL
jgi:hypothetical protein